MQLRHKGSKPRVKLNVNTVYLLTLKCFNYYWLNKMVDIAYKFKFCFVFLF